MAGSLKGNAGGISSNHKKQVKKEKVVTNGKFNQTQKYCRFTVMIWPSHQITVTVIGTFEYIFHIGYDRL